MVYWTSSKVLARGESGEGGTPDPVVRPGEVMKFDVVPKIKISSTQKFDQQRIKIPQIINTVHFKYSIDNNILHWATGILIIMLYIILSVCMRHDTNNSGGSCVEDDSTILMMGIEQMCLCQKKNFRHISGQTIKQKLSSFILS